MKVDGIKSYHRYISNDKKHDQSFVKVAIEEMLNETAVQIGSNIIIESDNCSSQYKSCQHFYGMQLLANHYDINMICIFGIAENGKGEVDHIGGLTKTAIRREIAAGEFLVMPAIWWCFWRKRLKVIQQNILWKKLINNCYKLSELTTSWKTSFQSMALPCSKLFFLNLQLKIQKCSLNTKNTAHVLAASRLYLCSECKIEYGSCDLFKHYTINVKH